MLKILYCEAFKLLQKFFNIHCFLFWN
jgi:hypothetical protein